MLTTVTRPLVLFNDSPIAAYVKTFAARKGSGFYTTPTELTLDPHQSVEVAVCVCLDETLKQTDQIHVIVYEGVDLVVPVEAKGEGMFGDGKKYVAIFYVLTIALIYHESISIMYPYLSCILIYHLSLSIKYHLSLSIMYPYLSCILIYHVP